MRKKLRIRPTGQGQNLLERVVQDNFGVTAEVATVLIDQACDNCHIPFTNVFGFGAFDWTKEFAAFIDDAAVHSCADEACVAFFAFF